MCVTFKDVAAVFLRRWQEANRLVPRNSGLDQEIRVNPPDVVIPIGPAQLAGAGQQIFARVGADPDLDHLDLDLPSVEAAIQELRSRIGPIDRGDIRRSRVALSAKRGDRRLLPRAARNGAVGLARGAAGELAGTRS